MFGSYFLPMPRNPTSFNLTAHPDGFHPSDVVVQTLPWCGGLGFPCFRTLNSTDSTVKKGLPTVPLQHRPACTLTTSLFNVIMTLYLSHERLRNGIVAIDFSEKKGVSDSRHKKTENQRIAVRVFCNSFDEIWVNLIILLPTCRLNEFQNSTDELIINDTQHYS